MRTRTKSVSGELLDIEKQETVSSASVEITLKEPEDPTNRSLFEVNITIEGYRPDLDNKRYVLKLSQNLAGEVFVTISGIPTRDQTSFSVNLQDSVWNNTDWFEAL